MAFQELSLSTNAIDVAINVIRTNQPIALICLLHREGISLYEWALTSKPLSSPSLKWFTSFTSDNFSSSIQQQIAFSGERFLSVLGNTAEGSVVHIIDRINGSIDKKLLLAGEKIQALVGQVVNANSGTHLLFNGVSVVSPKTLDDQMDCLSIVQTLGLSPNSSPRVEVVGLQIMSPQLQTSSSYNGDDPSSTLVVFGLCENGVLFANDRVLTRNCTSFLVTPAHLIFTTGQHLLKFVHMVQVKGR